MQYRHEYKQELNRSDLAALRHRLGAVLTPDAHGEGGRYLVRSLYFDNAADHALREKLSGVDRREKFRIRYYDRDPSRLRLEKKTKQNGLGAKRSEPITAGEAEQLLSGRLDWMAASARPLACELYGKMRADGLRPRVIVDYTREAFVFGPGNVRVTLDHDLRAGLDCRGFLQPGCVTVPVPDAPVILEVKWDGFLPELVRGLVQLPGRRTSAFSKYAACRMFE